MQAMAKITLFRVAVNGRLLALLGIAIDLEECRAITGVSLSWPEAA
jgi:hypothetical protein